MKSNSLLFLTSYPPHSPVLLHKGNQGYEIPIKLARNILFVKVNKTNRNMVLDGYSRKHRYRYRSRYKCKYMTSGERVL